MHQFAPIFTNYFTYFYNYACFVVIRSNSANTNITIDAANDTVNHYDVAGKVTIKQINTSSYHENGDVAYMVVNKGHVEVEDGASIDLIYANPGTYSGDTFTSDMTVKVTVTNNGDIDHAHVVGSGTTGQTNAAKVNGVSTGVTFDYDENPAQNQDAEVYHHVTVTEANQAGNEVKGDKGVTKDSDGKVTSTEGSTFNPDTVGETIVSVAQGKVVKVTTDAGVSTLYTLTGFKDAWNADKQATTFTTSMTYEIIGDWSMKDEDAWTSGIGTDTRKFNVKLEGNYHTISNLTVISEGANAGFIYRANGCEIDNLYFSNVTVSGTEKCAAVVGRSDGVLTLNNVQVLSGSVTSQKYSGGLVGKTYDSVYAKDCINYATLTATGQNTIGTDNDGAGCGGIIACVDHSYKTAKIVIFENCENYGNMTTKRPVGETEDVYAGGILGYLYTPDSCKLAFVNCSNNGSLTSADETCVGALLGKAGCLNIDPNTGKNYVNIYIKNCFNNNAKITDTSAIKYVLSGGYIATVEWNENGAEKQLVHFMETNGALWLYEDTKTGRGSGDLNVNSEVTYSWNGTSSDLTFKYSKKPTTSNN